MAIPVAPTFATPLPSGLFTKSVIPSYVGRFPVVAEPSFLVAGAINGAPVWPSFALANGTVGVAYSQSWDLSPALSPTTYTLASGSLPTGLALSNITGDQGQLTGTPTVAGSYTFTITATNALGSSNKSFTVTIGTAVAGGSYTFLM